MLISCGLAAIWFRAARLTVLIPYYRSSFVFLLPLCFASESRCASDESRDKLLGSTSTYLMLGGTLMPGTSVLNNLIISVRVTPLLP